METKQYPDMECDVVIAGCGVAGLYAALNLPTSTRVIMLSKGAQVHVHFVGRGVRSARSKLRHPRRRYLRSCQRRTRQLG